MTFYRLKNLCNRAVFLSALIAGHSAASAPAARAFKCDKSQDHQAKTGSSSPLSAEKCEPVRANIKIAAPAPVVWRAVHEERKHDPDMAYSKVISEGNNEFLLEQKFTLLPIIGTSVCQMQQKETPGERIDYKLVKSDRFKVMEGSWVLVPSADNKSTTLELTTCLDLGMPVPRNIINHVTAKKLERRLEHIKVMAESEYHATLAESKKSVN